MKKKYTKIEFEFGDIESAIRQLETYKEKNELAYGVFNGVILHSNVDDVNSAYKKITGKTKSEFDQARKEENDKYQEQKRNHEKLIPQLTKEWIDKGSVILDKKYQELWAKCVPIRLSDLYEGMELQCCINIIVELNNNCTLDEAKNIIESQGHSGMSFSLVRSMVKSFCNRGEEFYNYVKL